MPFSRKFLELYTQIGNSYKNFRVNFLRLFVLGIFVIENKKKISKEQDIKDIFL